MRIGFYQFQVQHGKKNANLNNVYAQLSEQKFDLLVLPELFSIGRVFKAKGDLYELSEEVPEGPTTKLLVEIAKHTGGCIVGGVCEREGDALYNASVVVGPKGYMGRVRKKYLSNYETRLFDRGDGQKLFKLGEFRFGVLNGFELCYPEACRTLMYSGADMIIAPGSFGDAWNVRFAKARALENLVYVVTCNRTGTESNNKQSASFFGSSQIALYDGEQLASAGSDEALVIRDVMMRKRSERESVIAKDIARNLDSFENIYPIVF